MVQPEPWTEHAACKGMDPDLFFPARGDDCDTARAVCRTCPVMAECREYGMAERFGVYGGLTERERRRVRRNRKAAA